MYLIMCQLPMCGVHKDAKYMFCLEKWTLPFFSLDLAYLYYAQPHLRCIWMEGMPITVKHVNMNTCGVVAFKQKLCCT